MKFNAVLLVLFCLSFAAHSNVDAQAFSPSRIAATDGSVVTFDPASGTLQGHVPENWQCTVEQSLSGTLLSVAARGDLVLILSHAGQSAERPILGEQPLSATALLVEAESCDLVREFAVPGIIPSVIPAKHGWLLRSRNLVKSSTVFSEMDDEGEAHPIDIPEELYAPQDLASIAARNAYIASVDGDLWLVPTMNYVLWQPAKAGHSARSLEVPACLEQRGRMATREEARAAIVRAMKEAGEDRPDVLEAIDSADTVSHVEAAVRGVTTGDGLLAVLVHTDAGHRVDVWDMATPAMESIVAQVQLDGARPYLAGIADHRLWWFEGEELKSADLGYLPEPIEDPCPSKDTPEPASRSAP